MHCIELTYFCNSTLYWADLLIVAAQCIELTYVFWQRTALTWPTYSDSGPHWADLLIVTAHCIDLTYSWWQCTVLSWSTYCCNAGIRLNITLSLSVVICQNEAILFSHHEILRELIAKWCKFHSVLKAHFCSCLIGWCYVVSTYIANGGHSAPVCATKRAVLRLFI